MVHITTHLQIGGKSNRVNYRISSCICEQGHTQLSPRVRGYEHETDRERVCTRACESHKANLALQRPAYGGFPLQLLQVCRQIYHEAALKPFQKAFFQIRLETYSVKDKGFGLQAFMNALIPSQLKAITHLRLLSSDWALRRLDKLEKLESLRHLELQIDLWFLHFDHIPRLIGSFTGDIIARSLANLNLKSIRLGLDLDSPDLLGRNLKLLTMEDAEIFEKILERAETNLLKSRR